jgi:hypothetical protein
MASALGFYVIDTTSTGIIYTAPANTMVHIKWYFLKLYPASASFGRMLVRDSTDTTTIYQKYVYQPNSSTGGDRYYQWTLNDVESETYTGYQPQNYIQGSGDELTPNLHSFYLQDGQKLKFEGYRLVCTFLAIGEPN